MLLLPAVVTAVQARDVLHMLSQALKRETDPAVLIDAAGLGQFDSAALALLLECRRLAEAWGKEFQLRNPPPKLVQLAHLYGVDELVGIQPT